MNLYRFIDTEKAVYPIRLLCRVLSVPESSYFDWDGGGRDRQRQRDDARDTLIEACREVHVESGETYGAPRVHGALVRCGHHVTARRVAETMRYGGLVGWPGHKTTVTTRRARLEAPFPDLVNRTFQPIAPNTLWYGDVTYIWVNDKFWYLATVIDGCTKELLGWAFADHMRTELVANALHNAVKRRGGHIPAGVIFHSDRGSQYTSHEYGLVCGLYKIRQSMGRRGVCYDNAAAESFFATIKRELVDRYRWTDPTVLNTCLFNWIETWYNRKRLHTSLGMCTPHETYLKHTKPRRVA
jgi:putative transposase